MNFDLARANEVLWQIGPMLHGLGPKIQGAVLAHLFAMYIAGHQGPDAPEVREEIIASWLEMVRGMVPLYEKEILANVEAGGHS